ncbi:hypothetical protein E4U19_001883 [Claviceps sp. Clav32 group G5]|nr:hypothetical protein E4U19_001883 [Claviceps sp. Clav32 group G5]KAG6045981.1 hypothetical protein E4U39_001761 [Claviceps sp. Clav50 group G5]
MSTANSPTTPHERLPPSSSLDGHELSVLSPTQSLGDDVSAHDGDLDKHPKGKRKRTAAKDKMILENAYRNNPKPDKQARQEIVDRVSLNEKEVQIWFQNRRQNDRRKSRPLSSEELAALRFGGMHHLSSDPMSMHCTMVNTMETADRPFSSSDPASRPVEHGPVSPRAGYVRREFGRSCSDVVIATPRSHDPLPQQSRYQQGPVPDSEPPLRSISQSQSFASTPVGYLANRWNLGSSFSTPSSMGRAHDDTSRLHPFPPSCSSDRTHNAHSGKPELQSSQVRLSLSLEGKAELVSGQASPTRPPTSRTPPSTFSSSVPPRPRGSLARSHSAASKVTLPPFSALTSYHPPRLTRGRSRDVQAWESCADSERRDELTAQAEHESSGSAIAAISLLRSTSGILQPSSAKRNASLSRPQQPRQSKKAKVGRPSSTLARLQAAATTPAANTEKQLGNHPDGKVKVSMLVSPTDSDKENWSPDEDGHSQGAEAASRRRPLPVASAASKLPPSINPRRLGRVLTDQNIAPPMLGSRAHTAPTYVHGSSRTPSPTIAIFQDQDGPARKRKKHSRADDVEKFMRGEVVSPSKKPDMDCVAGLLSLSQGAWR